jgi:hypothetical protein
VSTGGELVVVVLQHLPQIPDVKGPAAERAVLDMPALLGYGIIRRAGGYTSKAILPPHTVHFPNQPFAAGPNNGWHAFT